MTEAAQPQLPTVEAVPEVGGREVEEVRAIPGHITQAPAAEEDTCPQTLTEDIREITGTLTRAEWIAAWTEEWTDQWTAAWTGQEGPMPGQEVPHAGSPPAPQGVAAPAITL